jgi:hypothetical protein
MRAGGVYCLRGREGGRSLIAGPCRLYNLCNWRGGCHHREHSRLHLNGPYVGKGVSSDHWHI